MSKKISVVIELNYDIDDLRYAVGDFPDSEFAEQVEEMVHHDLLEVMRGSAGLQDWAKVTETD